MQTRVGSIVEVVTNYVLGFILAWLMNKYVLRWLGYNLSGREITGVTLIFTMVSVIRSYVVRRFFNFLMHRPK